MNIDTVKKLLANQERTELYSIISKLSNYSENTFVYEDDIRGMSDFAKYLRRYGSSVKVIEPEKLKKMMMNSITRMEMVYRKEGLYV